MSRSTCEDLRLAGATAEACGSAWPDKAAAACAAAEAGARPDLAGRAGADPRRVAGARSPAAPGGSRSLEAGRCDAGVVRSLIHDPSPRHLCDPWQGLWALGGRGCLTCLLRRSVLRNKHASGSGFLPGQSETFGGRLSLLFRLLARLRSDSGPGFSLWCGQAAE